jgi:hypothetical protein
MFSANVEPDDEEGSGPSRSLTLKERTPAYIERQVMEVSVQSELDDLAAALDATDWLLARAKTIDRLMKQIAIAWIDQNGEFNIGEQHYSVGYATTFKCLNIPQTGHAILEAGKGDIDILFALLVSQPFKPASVRNLIDMKLYASLFKAHRTGRLINGVPERLLKRTDARFVPRKM